MPDENEGDKPRDDPAADSKPFVQPTIVPAALPEQGVSGEKQATNSGTDEKAPATKKELHFLERLNIFANLSLVIVGIIAASIYHRQLTAMQGQLNEMHGSGIQTDKLLCLYGKQLEQITKQAVEMHTLAEATKGQSTASRSIARTTKEALYISERAYLSFQAARFLLDQHAVTLSIANTGRIPATDVNVVAHKAIFELQDPKKRSPL